MFDIVFYSRRTRHVMAGSGQFEWLPDPKDPLAPNALHVGDLAQAWNLHDRRDVRHFDSKEWRDGPLPGAVNHMRR